MDDQAELEQILEETPPTTADDAQYRLARALDSNLSKTGLELPEGLSQEKWLWVVTTLFTFHKTLQWAIGDALLYGEINYPQGEDSHGYAAVSKLTGYPLMQLYDIASVCRHVPSALRNEVLSFSHHRAIRSLPPDRQSYWLKTAAEFGFSVERLRLEISVMEPNGAKLLLPYTDKQLLPPGIEPEPSEPEPEPPKPKAKKATWSRKGVETHLTNLERDALGLFAAEKKLDKDKAIRALVTMGLHGFGHLQKAFADSLNDEGSSAETVYLIYLGKNWFAEPDKFKLEKIVKGELLDTDSQFVKETPVGDLSGGSLIAQMEQYIKMVAKILPEHPETTVENVQGLIGGTVPKKYAAHILSEAKKVVALQSIAASASDANGEMTEAEHNDVMAAASKYDAASGNKLKGFTARCMKIVREVLPKADCTNGSGLLKTYLKQHLGVTDIFNDGSAEDWEMALTKLEQAGSPEATLALLRNGDS